MVILALGAALALVLATALLAWRSHVQRRRRFSRAVQALDESLDSLGESMRRALESAAAPPGAPPWMPAPEPDVDQLLIGNAARARKTDVEAAALRVPAAGDDVAVAAVESAGHDGDTSPEAP